MTTYRKFRVRDPLHNIINFDAEHFDNVMWKVIQTRPFQRLRRIKQLGFSDFVYPGACHSRLAHSVGVFHPARQLMSIIEHHLGISAFHPPKAQMALAAALVHDVGHGPFSHAFESVGRRLGLKLAKHEVMSDALIRNGEVAEVLKDLGSGAPNDIANIVARQGPADLYDAVVSSQFDADRLDYIRRDRLMTGSQHAAIDFHWLMSNLEIGEVTSGVDDTPLPPIETFVLGSKAVFAAEAYVLGLFQLYPTIYFHKATRGAERLFEELMVRIVHLVRNKNVAQTGLPKRYPLVVFALNSEKEENGLLLDDTVIWGALHLLSEAADKWVSEGAQRLRDRKLYKAIDVRENVKIELGLEAATDEPATKKIDMVCAKIMSQVGQYAHDNTESNPDSIGSILCDHEERNPYKRFQESKGPLNQIRIKLPSGNLVDLADRSNVVRSIDTFKLDRAYTRPDDHDSIQFIRDTIKKEVNHARAD